MGIETWHERTVRNPTWWAAERLKHRLLKELNLPENTVKKGELADVFTKTALFRFGSKETGFSSLTPWEEANASGRSDEILSSPVITVTDIDEVLTRNWATAVDLLKQIKAGGKISPESFRQTVRDHTPWRNLMALDRLGRMVNNQLVITTRRCTEESLLGQISSLFSPRIEGFLPCPPVLSKEGIAKIENRYRESHALVLGKGSSPRSAEETLVGLIEKEKDPYVVVVESSLYPGLEHFFNLLKRLKEEEYPFDKIVCVYGGHLVL